MRAKSRNSVLIVVLNFNGFTDTRDAIKSLLGQTYEDIFLLVIDNGSRNDRPLLEKLYSNLQDDRTSAIYNTRNLGFAGGVNVGIKYAIRNNYEQVVLFNNDAIAEPDWVSSSMVALQKTNADIITGLILNRRGLKIDSTAEGYSTWGMPFSRARGEKVDNSPESGYVFGATGGASLYKTSLFKEIGLFDESFFAYYEDVDISFRAQLAGHKVYFTDKAVAYHKQGATSKKIPGLTVYQTFKNIPLLFTKNVPAGLLLPIGIRLLLLYILIFGNAVKNGSGKYALKGWLASIWYFWTRAIWQRIRIQTRRKVSTEYINSIIWHDIPPNQTGMRKFRKFFTGKA